MRQTYTWINSLRPGSFERKVGGGGRRTSLSFARSLATLCILSSAALTAQNRGAVEGTVTMVETGDPLHGAVVLIVDLGRSTNTDENGRYRFDQVPPGSYDLITHLDSIFTEATKRVVVDAGKTKTVDFALELMVLKHQIIVTASGKEETAFSSFQSVESLDSFDLAENATGSLGEALDHRVGTGIAKRSFGPGSSRPIIRGFDGDRVLVMEDGIRTGTLSSQSGDHGEVLNTGQLDRLEIVKGPATLLYGSNAMGGTVNAVSRHHAFHQHPHQGLRGFVSGSAGSANSFGGGNAGFEYGVGKWMIWGSGGGSRNGDYDSPAGPVFNSRTRSANGRGGFGHYGERMFFSFNVQLDDGFYGVPFAHQFEGAGEGKEAERNGRADFAVVRDLLNPSTAKSEEGDEIERISIDARRATYRFDWGLLNFGRGLDNFTLKLNFTDWEHEEVEFFEDGEREVGTRFDNRQFVYRGEFEQRPKGSLTGRFGFWGLQRDYDVAGEEALSPPVDQTGFAAFALEELAFEQIKFQFGGRLETNRYTPAFAQRGPENVVEPARKRTFTGASAAAGLHAGLWQGGAFVANYAHSHRAPALEELYNFGPHLGNLAFEIGDPNLEAETGNGLDLSLRHDAGQTRAQANFFYYSFDNFVFPFATGDVADGLRVVEFTQLDARFVGAEAGVDVGLHDNLWLNLGADYVSAKETVLNTPLPRIPPMRGKVGLDFHLGNLSVKPELIVANQQHLTFSGETRTPGYAVVNLKASYTIPQQHFAQQLSVNVFNIGDRLYRNHSSFIKDLAPEIGRGVRFSYTVRFF